jgi:hypothetical protein
MTTRQAVRVLRLDEADRVLLVRCWDGDRSWWLDELAGAADEFAPRRLPALTRHVVDIGLPERPIDVGV